MKKAILCLSLFALFFGIVATAGGADNPVKNEMRLMDAAFKNLMDALVLNELGNIEKPFHEVHAGRGKTEEAIKKGEVKLPKNNEKMKEFVEMDEAFHSDVEMLLDYASKGDDARVREITHKLLDGCVGCHRMFRK